MTIRPRRSVLYMPGSNARAIEKARTLPADGIIIDLEDAVAPDAKVQAREQVAAAVKAGGFGAREVFIRVNGIDTPWHAEDMAAAARAAPDAILVPKINNSAQLEMVGRRLLDMGTDHKTRIWAMIETPIAIINIADIAAAAKDSETRLSGFVLGTNDLAKETSARLVPGRAPMLPWITSCVLAARAYGIAILDGVFNDIGNAQGFIEECQQGRDLGMDGKTLIHPNQITPCNETFSPSDTEIAQARKFIAAFELPENADKGAIMLDGRMVERMHADIARRTVAVADAIAARS
ncbi:HpcH/HpaI aldolase/citrate lyase family protein [Pseudorhodoplanes sinuspersici]|uniref:CoA ester lyase n=1 Tax=Pseudorhodoplanes sinuspersici TaxID=1235591 RepID=A0A1W6ZNP1_9HYPH|nr:CoA ester lyase [Pseudorhodoplanes sinuspersici]ARP98979.1 CoA ester lyase [Pseudorhodoplanes sinuspersici]RKE69385.1 citrate lyase subunit beta/citryl-CoA lyase [Pseudorhodoplanes sinuspersici]